MYKFYKKFYRKRIYRNLNYYNLFRRNKLRDRKNNYNFVKNMYFILLISLKTT